jgi:predicted DNA-binding transcriptional regulator AlpA
MEDTVTNRFLNEHEVAERWGISPRTLQGFRYRDKSVPLQNRKGPPWVLIGGTVRYREADVLAFEQRNSSSSLDQ